MTDITLDYSNEIWKPVLGFEGLYEVSDMGRMRSLGQFVKQKNGKTRVQESRIFKKTRMGRKSLYFRVKLCKDGKQHSVFVHRAVLEAFVGKSTKVCEHLNGDPSDNRLSNLEYVSITENTRRGRTQKNQNVCIHEKAGPRGKVWKVIIQFTVNNGRAKWTKTYYNQNEAIEARDYMLKYFKLEIPSGVKNEHFVSISNNTLYDNNEQSCGRGLA